MQCCIISQSAQVESKVLANVGSRFQPWIRFLADELERQAAESALIFVPLPNILWGLTVLERAILRTLPLSLPRLVY